MSSWQILGNVAGTVVTECAIPTDGAASYTLALAAKRERGVRDGILPPRNDAERRQRYEGPRGWSALDCVREART